MIEKDPRKKLIFGGISNDNKEAEDLRRYQIIKGIRIHTCNNYGKSIEVIKNASRGLEKELKLLTKVYYRYPNIKNPRFRPIIDQLSEIIDRLGFIPEDWSLQICCYCALKELTTLNAKNFFKKINKKYNISEVYLEYYPVYNYELNQILYLNNFYKEIISFGLVGYQNLCNRVLSNDKLRFLSYNSIKVIFIGFLGRGNQNHLNIEESIKNLNEDEIINLNISYFISSQYKYKNIYGLTHVSSLNHFEDLNKRILDIIDNQQKNNFYNQTLDDRQFKIYYFDNFDQYGGYITFQQYLKNPKLIISKIKYIITSFIISSKFNNNFWG